MRVTDFVLAGAQVLERTCPEEHLNLSKSGCVSEEGHSGYKSQYAYACVASEDRAFVQTATFVH